MNQKELLRSEIECVLDRNNTEKFMRHNPHQVPEVEPLSRSSKQKLGNISRLRPVLV